MSFADPTNPLSWLLGSFALIALGTNIAWLIVRRRPALESLRRSPLAALGWLALALAYLLPPFLAHRAGALSPYALGLTEIDWRTTLSNGMVLAALIIIVLILGWLTYRRLLPDESSPKGLERVIIALRTPVEAALRQWHWAFYRAAIAGWLMLPVAATDAPLVDRILLHLQGDPLYWGVWLALAVAGLEGLLDPFVRTALRRPADRELTLLRGALAVSTAGLFVLTRNLWLCLLVQVVVETLAAVWLPLPLAAQRQVDQ